MKHALAPILFVDNDKPAAAAKRANPVAAAQRSDDALTKAARKRTADDTPVHSFTSLLADLATICANHIQPADDMPAIHHDHHPHPTAAASLRTTRRLPPPRPGVVSTNHPTDHKTPGQHPNPSTQQGELRPRRRGYRGRARPRTRAPARCRPSPRARRRCPQRRINPCATQIGLVQLGVLQSGTAEVGTPEHRLAQVGFDQAGFPQPAVGEVDAAQIRSPEHGQREVDLHQLHRPHTAFGEHRPQETAMAKRAVQQRCPTELAVAERGAVVLGFGQIDAAEIALGEHDALGADPAQIVVTEVVADRIPARSRPFRLRSRGQPRTGVRLFSAYSVTAISAARSEWRSRASTVMIGMSVAQRQRLADRMQRDALAPRRIR